MTATTERVVQAAGLLMLAIAGALIAWVAWHVKGDLWLAVCIGGSVPAEGAAAVAVGAWVTRRRDRRRRTVRVTRDISDPNWIPPGWFLPSHDRERPPGPRP